MLQVTIVVLAIRLKMALLGATAKCFYFDVVKARFCLYCPRCYQCIFLNNKQCNIYHNLEKVISKLLKILPEKYLYLGKLLIHKYINISFIVKIVLIKGISPIRLHSHV